MRWRDLLPWAKMEPTFDPKLDPVIQDLEKRLHSTELKVGQYADVVDRIATQVGVESGDVYEPYREQLEEVLEQPLEEPSHNAAR